ncbi:MAG TPA: hypothetical protein VJ485_02115 [archaeon]|nr:hypothetical protein [archaeon]
MNPRIILPLGMVLLLSFLAPGAEAATIDAKSCSYADVSAAYNAASDGDTVAIPAGSCNWTSTLTITKPITLQGAGASSTTLTHNAGNYVPLIKIDPASGKEAEFFRVTGIYFENVIFCPSCGANQYTPDIELVGKATSFRIDNNMFHNGKKAISASGWLNGVIDNNTFADVDLSIYASDDSDYRNLRPTTNSWGRPIQAGATNSDCIFIEANTFTTSDIRIPGNGCRSLNEYIYHANGARTTIRYNTFTSACYSMDALIDAHGRFGCDRGTVLVEMYENTFEAIQLNKWMNLRGGSMVVHDNTLNITEPIVLWNEGEWCHSSYFCDDEWPYMDQIFNSFFWNNYNNGVLMKDIAQHEYNAEGTFDSIVKDRDYFMHAPAATGGKETFGGYPGYSNDYCKASGIARLPAAPETNVSMPCCTGVGTGTCDMTFSSSGPNAYYPYSPYTFPHPLRSEPPVQSCTYTYSAWGVCQSNNTQTRTVISSSPAGCTGTPILTQSCIYTPQNFLPEQYIQAESGQLTSMQTVTSGSDTYIYTDTSYQGSAKFTFDIQQTGQYRMEARVNSNNDSGRNSFYVGLDNEPAQGNNSYTYALPLVNSFAWDDVNKVGNGTALPQFDPMLWYLSQGLHTFTFYGRESNSWLDQIILKRIQVHKSDSNSDGCVSSLELSAFISLWYLDSSNPTIRELIEAIGLWKRGGC